MRVALCQVHVEYDAKRNLDQVRTALRDSAGADLAVFPEAVHTRYGNDRAAPAEPLDGPFVTGLRQAAAEHGVALIAGVFEQAADGRVYNTAVAVDSEGQLVGSYRKIHLFDAFSYRESDDIAPGDAPVVVELAGVRIGLSVCYDLRFPEMFRALVDAGADMFVIIAAWAQGSFKEEHWCTLTRSRAIENTTWTVAVDKAPDRTPTPDGGMTGVGRSLLVDPMGVVCSDLGPSAGVLVVDVDLSLTHLVRRKLPSLSHRRLG